MAARQQHQDSHTPGSPQRRCARDLWCSARTRDPETGEWHPAPATQPLCPACQDGLLDCLGALPGCYERLAGQVTAAASLPRTGRAVRSVPGSRVLVDGEADALMRTLADTIGGWAARVRAVPQLSLAPPAYPPGTVERVRADCRVLAAHPGPLMALPLAEMTRTWTFTPGRHGMTRPAVPCRRCALPVTPAPSGKRWWPAACTHAPAALTPAPGENGEVPAWLCRSCGRRLPASWTPPPSCRHEPSGPLPSLPAPVPPETEDKIGDQEVILIGDGWVTVLTRLDGEAAVLDIIEHHQAAVRLLRENPARPVLLDGVPCRACEAMSSLEMLPAPPPDPQQPEREFCRCSVPGCRNAMTRSEYDEWAAKYAAWTRGAGILTCRRCELAEPTGEHKCQWHACQCRKAGHAAA